MTDERFFRGFLAALRLTGQTFIDTRQDVHHRRFASVAELLKKERSQHVPGAAGMPRTLVPSPFTGRFREFDNALLEAQRGGIIGVHNPFYPGANVQLSQDQAESLLDNFQPDEKALFLALADAWTNSPEKREASAS